MNTIFSKVKGEVLAILTRELVDTGIVQEVRYSRGYGTDISPYVIITTDSYDRRVADDAHEVYLKIVTLAKFDPNVSTAAAEEELAEQVLDNVEGVLIDCFDETEGRYQKHKPYWGGIDRHKRSWRPFSPIGPGWRYAESYFRFIAYGV